MAVRERRFRRRARSATLLSPCVKSLGALGVGLNVLDFENLQPPFSCLFEWTRNSIFSKFLTVVPHFWGVVQRTQTWPRPSSMTVVPSFSLRKSCFVFLLKGAFPAHVLSKPKANHGASHFCGCSQAYDGLRFELRGIWQSQAWSGSPRSLGGSLESEEMRE